MTKTALITGVTAHQRLGWRHRTSFRQLASEMVAVDLQSHSIKERAHVDA